MAPTPPPDRFKRILAEHMQLAPVAYQHHKGTEAPHMFTFPTQGCSHLGHQVSFSLNMADLQILMELHGLKRMQSNAAGEITLYFGEMQ